MQQHTSKHISTNVAPRGLLFALVIIFLIVFFVGAYYYHHRKEQIKQEKFNELAAITQSKIKRIVNWRQKIINVADTWVANPLIMDELEFFIDNRGKGIRRRYIDFWLLDQQNKYYKKIYLLDRNGRICLKSNHDKHDDPPLLIISELFGNDGHTGKIVFSDLYKNSSQEIVLSILIPLLKSSTLFGAFFAEIDPYTFLFPLIAEWPVPSQTAETLMVRREGNAILYLNELRHRKNMALTLRLPVTRLNEKSLPATYVATGWQDRLEGTDYRSAAVIASVGKVPGTTWFIISKVDKNEIFEPLNTTMAQIFFFVIALILMIAWVLIVMIHQQRTQLLRTQLQAQTDRKALVRHFDYLSQNANDFIFLLNDTGEIIYANRKAQSLYGYDPEELLTMNVEALKAPLDTEDRFKQVIADNALLQEGITFEDEHQRQDGSLFPVECSIHKVEIEDAYCYFQIIGRDISLKKEKDAKITMLSQALEQSPISVIITDLDANIEYVNPIFTHMTGYSYDEVIGQNPSILQSGETPKHVFTELWSTITDGKVWHGEFYNKRKNGAFFWEDTTILPLKNKRNRITNYMGLKIDITPRKNLEVKLAEHRKQLEQKVKERTFELDRSLKKVEEAKDRTEGILASIADGLIVTDLNNRIVLMNCVAQKLFQVRLEDVINQSLDTVISYERLRNDFKMIPKQRQSDVIFDFEVASPDKSTIKTFNARTSVFKDQNGTVSGKITLFRDISQMREADRMKNEFISTAAHEMRTPLTSIQGFSELLMLREDLSNDEKHKYLNYINQKAVNLSEIISDFLDIEHIESGRSFHLKKTLCSIDNMIKITVELFSTPNGAHRFETHFAERDVQLNIDETKIGQMLKNLVDNAVKYSPNGGRIRISGKICRERYEITIKDQGMGMTPKETAKVFDKFFRASATTTSIEGTGLGMSMAKYIVEAHKGDITVASNYGEGTRVVVTLPMPHK